MIERYEEPALKYANDTDAVLDRAVDNLTNYKAHHNRKYVYEPTQEGFERFQHDTEEYFKWCRNANKNMEDTKKGICPDIEGWCTWLSLTRVTVFRYHKERGEPWTSYIDYVREQITAVKKQYALNGRIPPMTAVFDLVNNSHYLNTSCFTRQIPTRDDGVRRLGLEDLPKFCLELKERGILKDEDGRRTTGTI